MAQVKHVTDCTNLSEVTLKQGRREVMVAGLSRRAFAGRRRRQTGAKLSVTSQFKFLTDYSKKLAVSIDFRAQR